MFNLFKPTVTLLDVEHATVRLRSRRRLKPGFHHLKALVGSESYLVRVRITEQAADGAYQGVFLEPARLLPHLEEHFERERLRTPYDEKRNQPRRRAALAVRSPQLPNFRGLTWDISRDGLRLVVDGPVNSGETLHLELEPTEYGSRPVPLVAQTVWCRARDERSYFLGARFASLEGISERRWNQLVTQSGQ